MQINMDINIVCHIVWWIILKKIQFPYEFYVFCTTIFLSPIKSCLFVGWNFLFSVKLTNNSFCNLFVLLEFEDYLRRLDISLINLKFVDVKVWCWIYTIRLLINIQLSRIWHFSRIMAIYDYVLTVNGQLLTRFFEGYNTYALESS